MIFVFVLIILLVIIYINKDNFTENFNQFYIPYLYLLDSNLSSYSYNISKIK